MACLRCRLNKKEEGRGSGEEAENVGMIVYSVVVGMNASSFWHSRLNKRLKYFSSLPYLALCFFFLFVYFYFLAFTIPSAKAHFKAFIRPLPRAIMGKPTMQRFSIS